MLINFLLLLTINLHLYLRNTQQAPHAQTVIQGKILNSSKCSSELREHRERDVKLKFYEVNVEPWNLFEFTAIDVHAKNTKFVQVK
jgi:hypothetical protein